MKTDTKLLIFLQKLLLLQYLKQLPANICTIRHIKQHKNQTPTIMKPDITHCFDHCPLFAGMQPQTAHSLLDTVACKTIRMASRDIYCTEGTPCTHADIVLCGSLTVTMTGMSGRTMQLQQLGCGEIIAPAYIFATDNHMPVTIVCDSDVTLLRLSRQALQHIIDTDGTMRANFMRLLSDTGARLTSKIRFLSLMTVREKIGRFLLNKAHTRHALTITLDMSRQRLADMFAIQKYSLLRCLACMSAEGIIAVDGRKITILKPHLLR